MHYTVVRVEVCGHWSLRLTFEGGSTKRVNLRHLRDGPVFRPLNDPDYFARVSVDHEAGTIVWPNGADVAPDALYVMPEEQESAPE